MSLVKRKSERLFEIVRIYYLAVYVNTVGFVCSE